MRLAATSILSLLVLVAVPTATAQTDPSGSSTASTSQGATAEHVSEDRSRNDIDDLDDDLWDDASSYVYKHTRDYVGAEAGWTQPYERESTIYRAGPPLRYNRVEGPVVGFQRGPLSLRNAHDTARIYGQVGYAFALKDLRYTIGVESKLIRDPKTSLKIGASYQKQTLSPDRWKTSYAENSIGGIGFEYDFFDYYEAEGLSLYAVQALPHTLRLTAGFRAEEHRSLDQSTGWSLFEVGNFRPNPRAEEGRLQAAFASLKGGHIRDHDDLPSGGVFRIAATLGSSFGGDLGGNRYEVDGRVFLPLTPDTRLGLRLRGGYATSDASFQTQFTLGGIGSVRSYDQNARRGTRMLLGNVEYMIDGATLDEDFLDDLFLVGLFDAGWVGQSDQRFRTADVLPSAGVGIGLDERQVRLDVTWPLRNVPATGSSPSIWLRITPNF
jgi:hypothetical protein